MEAMPVPGSVVILCVRVAAFLAGWVVRVGGRPGGPGTNLRAPTPSYSRCCLI